MRTNLSHILPMDILVLILLLLNYSCDWEDVEDVMDKGWRIRGVRYFLPKGYSTVGLSSDQPLPFPGTNLCSEHKQFVPVAIVPMIAYKDWLLLVLLY